VDGEANVEFQAAQVHETQHWLGTTVRRRWLHLHASLAVLGQHRVHSKALERLIGKGSYIDSFRPCLRSLRSAQYVEVAAFAEKPDWMELSCDCWGELLISALLVPLAQQSLSSTWCRRIECYDAAPGGHGRSWRMFDEADVRSIAGFADQAPPHTVLGNRDGYVGGVPVDEKGKCPLHRVHLPIDGFWHETPALGDTFTSPLRKQGR